MPTYQYRCTDCSAEHEVVQWFTERHLGLLAGFGVVFLISGMTAVMNAQGVGELARSTEERRRELEKVDEAAVRAAMRDGVDLNDGPKILAYKKRFRRWNLVD